MSFDLAQITAELDAAPLEAPYPPELAIAVIADVLRDAGVTPPAAADFAALLGTGSAAANRPGQLAALARALALTALRPETVLALRARPPADPLGLLDGLLETIHPVTDELVAKNPFRREEVLRRWIEAVGGAIAGESAEESRRRLEQLDYRRTLEAYEKAEKSRLAEARKRADALRKAAEEAAEAAKGWRE
jgi:hypothetical protein